MMYVTLEDGTKIVGHVYDSPQYVQQFRDKVISVQADCDELEYIYMRRLYPHPHPLQNALGAEMRVVTFYGDTAKFIVGNW